jgi:hypothetical protein
MLIPFMLLIVGLVLGFVTAVIWALARWQGWWRWLAAALLLLVSIVVLKIILDTSIDPTSHNLWPFELLAVVLIAGGALGLLQLMRLFFTRIQKLF